MPKTKNGLAACTLSIFSTLFIGLALFTNSWLVSDGELENPQFLKIGLLRACFNNFEEPRHWYDTTFQRCLFVFQEEYYIISDIIFKPFFVVTQLCFIACAALTLVSVWYTGYYLYLNRKMENFVRALFKTGAAYTSAAACGTVGLIVFGMNGRGREWMPDWEHNNIGLSYWLAITGVVGHYICGLLFAIEGRARLMERRRTKARQNADFEDFDLDDFDMSLTVSEV